MYKISRTLLLIALLQLAACFAVVAALFPWPALIAACIVAAKTKKKRSLWAHGTSRWADESDLRRANMIGGTKGLAIGRLGSADSPPWLPSLLSILDWRYSAKEACDRCLTRLRHLRPPTKGEVVRLATSCHLAAFAPTGTGKGASLIIPWLLDVNESAVVLDYKGENAGITAKHREKIFGHRIVLLDPFNVVTRQPDCFNPIDFIEKDSPFGIDDCRDLAEQLVVRTGEEREDHWNSGAEMFIGGTAMAVIQHSDADNRSLQTVRDVLSDPNRLPALLELLSRSEGLVARMGNQLAHFRDRELSSVLTTTNRHLRFLDTPAIAESSSRSSFNPGELRNGKMTVYCILPPERIRAQSALIRMWIGGCMRAVVRGGLQRG